MTKKPPSFKEMRTVRKDALAELLILKFGNERGYLSQACSHLMCDPSNLSSMVKGAKAIPDRYFDELTELPNHKATPLENAVSEIYDTQTDEVTNRVSFDVTNQTYKNLRELGKHYNAGKAIGLDNPLAMAKIMSHIINTKLAEIRREKQTPLD